MKLFVAGVFTAIAVMSGQAAQASTVIYQTGFEQPEFNPGLVAGQAGWIWEGEIQGATVRSGSQAIHLDGSEFQTPAYLTNIPATGILTIKSAFLRTGDSPSIAAMWLRGDTGFIAQIQSNNGYFYLGNTNQGTASMYFGYGVWHELAMTFDFDAKTVTGSVDGTTLGTLAINNPVAPNTIVRMVLSTFAKQPGHTMDAYYDDVSIIAGGVPEPATWGLMLVGFGALGACLRRKRTAASFA
jgi:hypothetical protein